MAQALSAKKKHMLPQSWTLLAFGAAKVRHGSSLLRAQLNVCELTRSFPTVQVQLPVRKPLACTFGGPSLDQLFVTTRIEKGEGASEHWGSILSVKVPGVSGVAGAYTVET